jgi:endonuclease/exonuclease/phosphatase family metal-dependent hydrolase
MIIKILSWNIWIDSHFDLVKDFLKRSDADIIGLQEVREDDPLRPTIPFMESLGYQHVFAPIAKTWGGKIWNDGPAIFTRLEITDTQKYVLSKEDSRAAVRADIKVGDKVLHVFSTHLTHTHQQDSDLQLHQAEELLKVVPKESSIVMGDFNAIPKSSTIQKVTESLVDSDPTHEPTWSVYPEGCVTCNPQKIDTRLDYIFTTKKIRTHSFTVEDSKASDHLPISVTVEL